MAKIRTIQGPVSCVVHREGKGVSLGLFEAASHSTHMQAAA